MATISKQQGVRKTSYKIRIRKPNSPTVSKTRSSKNLAQKWGRRTEPAINGADPLEIAAVPGHKTLAMVQRWAQLSAAHTTSLVEQMNNVVFGDQ